MEAVSPSVQTTSEAAAKAVSPPARKPSRSRRWAPLEPVSGTAKWVLGVAFFVLFLLVWSAATLGGMVSPTFLASPVTMAQEAVLLFTEYGFHRDIGMTVWRVMGGFVLAAALAVPWWPSPWAVPARTWWRPPTRWAQAMPASCAAC